MIQPILNMLVLLCLAVPLGARWGTCPSAAVAAPVPPAYAWVAGQDPSQVHLFHNGRQIGTWRHDLQQYYPFDGTSWGSAAAPPVDPPKAPCDCCASCPCRDACRCRGGTPCTDACRCVVEPAGPPENYGIDEEQWRKEPRKQVVAARAQKPDDAHKLRLTVIGKKEEREQPLQDLRAHLELAPWRDRLVVQGYDPGHWAVRAGFRTDGRPTIYLQAPGGKVLHRQDDYDGGAVRLAEALRKADPNYDPRKDPDLRRGADPTTDWPAWLKGLVVAGAALFGVVAPRILRLLALVEAWRRTPPPWAVELQAELRRLKEQAGRLP